MFTRIGFNWLSNHLQKISFYKKLFIAGNVVFKFKCKKLFIFEEILNFHMVFLPKVYAEYHVHETLFFPLWCIKAADGMIL
jgi:hypothetical protein